MTNDRDAAEALYTVFESHRAEQRIQQPGIVTRTLSQSRRVPWWVILMGCVAGMDPLLTILSAVTGHAY